MLVDVRGSTMKRWQIGAVRVTRIEESTGPGFTPEQLFPDWSQEAVRLHWDWLVPHYFDPGVGRLLTSIHTWLLQTPAHNILVDTCAGNHKQREFSPRFHQLETPWLERLAETGLRPQDIDVVLCTHLHVDHVGWNTCLQDGRWIPTFPKARYLFSRIEHDHWSPQANPAIVERHPGKEQIYQDSVLPVVAAGLATLTDGEHVIDDWVAVTPAPGHTPGHVVVRIAGQDAKAVFSGDILHHPIQVVNPGWNSRFCELPEQAAHTRREVLAYCAEEEALLMPAHFAHPHVARIECSCGTFRFRFETPT